MQPCTALWGRNFVSWCVVLGSAYGGKANFPGDYNIVLSAGAVDNQDISICVPAAYNTHMTIARIKYKVAGLGIGPSNPGTVGVLGVCAPAVAYGVCSV